MIPCEFRPAATNRPGTSGIGPSWKFASGVNDSGARRKLREPEPLEARDPAPCLGEHGRDVVPVGPELREPAVVTPPGTSGRPSGSNAPMTSRPR